MAALAFLAACGSEAPPRGELELREAAVLELPGRTPVAGLAATGGGRVVAWSAERIYLAGGDSGRAFRELPEPPGNPVGAAFLGDTILEVMGAGGELVRYGGDGRRLGAARYPTAVPVQLAVRTGRGWVAGGEERSGRYVVFRVGDGHPLLGLEPDTSIGVLPGKVAVQLAAAGEDVLVTDLEPPYRTRRVRPDGTVAHAFVPAEPPTDLPADSLQRMVRWISLPVVPLAGGYLQTLADLGSDRRLLVLYDGRGREVRRRAVRAPLGITGISTDSKYLLASRNAGRPEALLYSWRWTIPPREGGEP